MSKAGIIVESSGKSVELKEERGLFECLLEHEVKATKADFNWTGKKIPDAVWHQVLMFFKWTQDTEKSESQVRLFVHPEHGWMAWAFPQKGGTSMTTKEIDNPDAVTQRAEKIPEGYKAFGTVHHHCTMSAFQSGTDLADEKNVDGLHITVGHLDKPQWDIHCRLYVKGHKFEPDMSAFWDIGEVMVERIKFVSDIGFKYEQVADKIARVQMCQPPPADTVFDPLWKENYIVEARTVGVYTGGLGSGGVGRHWEWGGHSRSGATGEWCDHCKAWSMNHKTDTCPTKGKKGRKGKHEKPVGTLTATMALRVLLSGAEDLGMSDVDFCAMIEEMGNGECSLIYQGIVDTCNENYLTLSSLWNALQQLKIKVSKGDIADITTSKEKEFEKARQEAIDEWNKQQAEGGGGYGC